jgi:hypothetical protein
MSIHSWGPLSGGCPFACCASSVGADSASLLRLTRRRGAAHSPRPAAAHLHQVLRADFSMDVWGLGFAGRLKRLVPRAMPSRTMPVSRCTDLSLTRSDSDQPPMSGTSLPRSSQVDRAAAAPRGAPTRSAARQRGRAAARRRRRLAAATASRPARATMAPGYLSRMRAAGPWIGPASASATTRITTELP